MFIKNIVSLICCFFIELLLGQLFAQTFPVEIKNNSPYNENDLYVAIVGISTINGDHVWIDCSNGQINPMSPSYNTVQGPVYGGNWGPGLNGLYASCFTKLSNIPNKKVSLPQIAGCRIFISAMQPLYFYFFGSSGSPSGYTSPNHTDPTDPNQNITYEIIELTYNQYGFWGNTTRVDAYRYPMGLELFSSNYYGKTGELKNHLDIGLNFRNNVPSEFLGCYNSNDGSIIFPTKTPDFADGSIGTMPTPGPYVDYLKSYIDSVWDKYVNEDLAFDAGDAGVWKGRVNNDQLVMVAQSGGYIGRQGIITRRPNTQEAFEGKGVLDHVVQDAPTDLLVQAQICAAITRHIISVENFHPLIQDWSNPNSYYIGPCNAYAKFWHLPGISFNQKSYGFAYDDVWDQSSTLHTTQPDSAIVWFGGFATGNTPTNVKSYLKDYKQIEIVNNPVSEYLIIKNITNQPLQIQLVDLTGKFVKSFNGSSTILKLQLSDILPGIYFIRINHQIFKIIKE